jgi:hypothetical protein
MNQTLRALCCCALGLVLTAGRSNAQTFYRSYDITAPNSGGIEHVIRTSDGGYLMLGSSVNDELVIKTNSMGYVTWAKKLTGGSSFLMRAAEASNGGYFILYFTGSQEGVLKLSSAGNVVFAKTYVQTSSSAINSFGFCATYDGGFLMGGGNCGLVNYVTKCDSAGNYVWGKQFKNNYSPGTHTVHQIIQSAAGKYMALCDDPTSSNGGYACFEFDGNGQMSWYKKYMPTTNDYHYPLQLVKHGKGYLIATAWKRQSQNETDYLTKIDALGNPLWTKTYSRPNKLQTAAMAVNDKGEILIAGSEVLTTNPRYLYFMMDSSGVVQWGKQSANITLQGAWGDNFIDATNAGNSFMLTGGTSGERLTAAMVSNTGSGMCNSTPVTITSGSATATVTQPTITPLSFTLNVNTITQTASTATLHDSVFCSQNIVHQGVAATTAAELRVYPNPAGDRIFVDAGNSTWQKAILTDVSGRAMATVVQNGRTASFDVSGIAAGIYLVVLYDAENAVLSRSKVVVQH